MPAMRQPEPAGDEAFRRLVESHRRELLVHCYRLLGSLSDAEDVLQEVLLAAWRGWSGFEGRASARTWLYRIATNRCLNAMRDANRRRRPEPAPPFEPPEPSRRGEVNWLEPCPDTLLEHLADPAPGPEARYSQKEAVTLAFITGLQLLPPRQAAALVLRDVLGFTALEVANLLDSTETAVKGALQRARASLRGHTAEPSSVGSPEERELTRRFTDSFVSGDIDGLVALLTDEAWLAMPPAPHEYHGPSAVAAFLRASPTWRPDRIRQLTAIRANHQPAFVCHVTTPGGEPEQAGVFVLTRTGDRIAAITRFLAPDVFDRFAS